MSRYIIPIATAWILSVWGVALLSYEEGGRAEADKWRQRVMNEGFSVVTRYNEITGEPKQVLIKLNKEAGK